MEEKPILPEALAIQAQPTPYDDVNAVLHTFASIAQNTLADQFVGMYAYGSLALGGFDPDTSDIDFIVITRGTLSDHHITALREIHKRFDASQSPWAAKLEAAYIPLKVLQHHTPTTTRYPQVEKGTALFEGPLEEGWLFQCYTLREHGIRVAGPNPHTLSEPITPRTMRRAVPTIPKMWQEQARSDPSWLDWLRVRHNQAFVVLTLCRLLFTLTTATVASKPTAAHWAQSNLDSQWTNLIEQALNNQHNPEQVPESDIESTLSLLQYTIEQCQAYKVL
ncbi:aminoglycoside adenylyltransferase domain-containing protein [Ktedonospora formicarum]|uniref:Nucleotidyltransferase n=1 Tax=Ktedonospora formicarum TaxID=2778364 RepID=A0A8J3I6I1_9CHLR|nr:aminoglycoside adenylyltransferase domain-containing protein [Ktedonospora formicarum]GHO46758.1 nucleotidyltransferase [Ktedonospora formicarum]